VVQEVVDAWNACAKVAGLQTVRVPLGKVYRDLVKRMLSDPERRDIWREALKKVPELEFPPGDGGRRFSPGLTWFLRPNGKDGIPPIVGLVNGKYDWMMRKDGEDETGNLPAGVQKWLSEQQENSGGDQAGV